MNLKRAKPCPYCEVAKELKNNFVKLEKKVLKIFPCVNFKAIGISKIFSTFKIFSWFCTYYLFARANYFIAIVSINILLFRILIRKKVEKKSEILSCPWASKATSTAKRENHTKWENSKLECAALIHRCENQIRLRCGRLSYGMVW